MKKFPTWFHGMLMHGKKYPSISENIAVMLMERITSFNIFSWEKKLGAKV